MTFSSLRKRPQGQVAIIGLGTVVGGAALIAGIYRLVRRQKWFFKMFQWRSFGKYKYPVTARRTVVDTFHGVKVEDPYRWLEDPTSPEVQAWVDAENECTDAYFSQLKDDKAKFVKRMSELYHYDKYSSIWSKGGRYFYYVKKGLQNQHVLCTMDTVDAAPRVLIDPNTLREDGTAALSGVYVSEDGSKAAYMVSFSGSDWKSIYVKDVKTGEMYDEEIKWCKFSNVAWTKDGKGFFYARYQAPSTEKQDDGAGTEVEAAAGQKVYYHKLGWRTDQDVLFYETPDTPKWLFGMEVSDDGETLMLTSHDSCDPVNRLFYFDLRGFDGENISTIGRVVKLVDDFTKKVEYITNEGRTFYFLTNHTAPKYKVVRVTLPPPGDNMETQPEALAKLRYEDVIAEDGAAVLQGVYVTAKKHFLLQYLRDVVDELDICDLDGKHRHKVDLPGKGSLESVCANKDQSEFFYKFTSFNDPGTVFRAVVTPAGADHAPKVESQVRFRSDIPGLDPNDFETTQEFYTSKDGTPVPMFITRPKAMPSGPRPTFLYGYGGFNISIRPGFNLSRLLFIKHYGGLGVVANIRGGGEYGESWHEAGTKHKKQNVFDDFISAAEHLVKKGITTPAQIAINGGSNGGLLVAACINQRPDLFAVAVAQVGVLDMLRFHKFTIGYAWCSDYGNADTDEKDFQTLFKYSPVHNVNTQAGPYPATLITTGDHDDRVVPLHSYKYIAALQHGVGGSPDQAKPLLIRVDTKSGHGAGKPTSKQIEEAADVAVFVAANTGAKWID